MSAEGLPAIIFYVRGSEVKDSKGEKFFGSVQLDAVFTDYTMWEDVLEQLDGFALNRGDLKAEIIDVLREKTRELQGNMQTTAADANTEVQRMRQQLAQAQSENLQLRAQVQELNDLAGFNLE